MFFFSSGTLTRLFLIGLYWTSTFSSQSEVRNLADALGKKTELSVTCTRGIFLTLYNARAVDRQQKYVRKLTPSFISVRQGFFERSIPNFAYICKLAPQLAVHCRRFNSDNRWLLSFGKWSLVCGSRRMSGFSFRVTSFSVGDSCGVV